MSRNHNFNVSTSKLGKTTYKRNTLRNFHCHIKFLKLLNPNLLKISQKSQTMSNPNSPNLDEVIGNVVEDILQERADEDQREMTEKESHENALKVVSKEIEVVVK